MINGRRRVTWVTAFLLPLFISLGGNAHAQVRPPEPGDKLPIIQPVYDGWYKNADGTLTFSYGYYNRSNEPIEIPKGPNNGFSPLPIDRGQPTVFQPGTERNVLLVILPGNFNQNLVWTISVNGMKASSTEKGGLNPLYIISDIPPRVTPDAVPGLKEGDARTVKVSTPLKLTATVRSNAPPDMKITYAWTKRVGPGDVVFSPADAAQTSATFSTPGDYVVRLTVSKPSGMDSITGSGDFRVTVQP